MVCFTCSKYLMTINGRKKEFNCHRICKLSKEIFTPGGDRGRFQTCVPLPHPPVSLGPVEVVGTLCQLPELCLQLATLHWLGTKAELVASRHT